RFEYALGSRTLPRMEREDGKEGRGRGLATYRVSASVLSRTAVVLACAPPIRFRDAFNGPSRVAPTLPYFPSSRAILGAPRAVPFSERRASSDAELVDDVEEGAQRDWLRHYLLCAAAHLARVRRDDHDRDRPQVRTQRDRFEELVAVHA